MIARRAIETVRMLSVSSVSYSINRFQDFGGLLKGLNLLIYFSALNKGHCQVFKRCHV